jgi:hypothetical protein
MNGCVLFCTNIFSNSVDGIPFNTPEQFWIPGLASNLFTVASSYLRRTRRNHAKSNTSDGCIAGCVRLLTGM